MGNNPKRRLTDTLIITAKAICNKNGGKDQIITPTEAKTSPVPGNWCLIKSAILDETIVLVSEKKYYEMAKAANLGKVLYSVLEIEELERLALDPDELRAFHQAKKAFNGWVVPVARQAALGLSGPLEIGVVGVGGGK